MTASSPIPFAPHYETAAPDEAETQAALTAALHQILETTANNYGHAVRAVHAKAHGLLRGTLEVPDALPEAYAQGLFAQPGRYPVAMRFSTNPGDILDDSVSTPRGLALKVIGVQGERLPGSEGATTQDFVMANAPAFAAATPADFLKNLKLLAKTTDTPQVWKKAFSTVLRGIETGLAAVGAESAALKNLGGQRLTHILGETFYSQTPMLFGRYFGKISVAPVSTELRALREESISVAGKPDALRDLVSTFFVTNSAVWEVRVQLCTDLETMPVEDASAVWPEETSPYVPVARLSVAPQPSWDAEKIRSMDDGLSFSPWHGLAAHRPLGGIMRARRDTYRSSADFRARSNGCPIHEPTA